MKLGRTLSVLSAVLVTAVCLGMALPASAAVTLEAEQFTTLNSNFTVSPWTLGGNVQMGSAWTDGNISAVVFDNPGSNYFTYTPTPNAKSYAAAQLVGGSYYGAQAVQKGAYDAYSTAPKWNFVDMDSGGTSGIYGAAAQVTPADYAIGYETVGTGSGQYNPNTNPTFGGVTVTSGEVVARETWVGDTTLKGYPSLSDFTNWRTGYIAYNAEPAGSKVPIMWSQGDFTYTGVASLQDFTAWRTSYIAYTAKGVSGRLVAPAGDMGSGGGPITPTPEPASIVLLAAGLLGAGALGFLGRRGEKRTSR
ncbi:MAG: hypothetical protein ABSG86_09930 [Thermoguttaceae bacterium]